MYTILRSRSCEYDIYVRAQSIYLVKSPIVEDVYFLMSPIVKCKT
jgi:hypothetical protein